MKREYVLECFHIRTDKKKPRALPVGLCSAALSSLVTVEQCRSFEEEEPI
jgi:hypothetical protein